MPHTLPFVKMMHAPRLDRAMFAIVALLATLLATLVVVPALRAQAPVSAQLAARLDAPTRALVLAIADSARAAGLPADPLFNKALEGASKHADGPRIVGAVRSLSRELATARVALGTASSEAELIAGAAALHAGIAVPTLVRFRPRNRSAATSLAVMSDLVARGVSADSAGGIVLALAGEDVPDAMLVAFQHDVERDIALGAPPSAAASVRADAFANTLAAGPVSENAFSVPVRRKRRP